MKTYLTVVAMVASLGCLDAFGDTTPTVNDAHEFIRDAVETNSLLCQFCILWPEKSYRYSSNGCISRIDWGKSSHESTEIDWSSARTLRASEIGDIFYYEIRFSGSTGLTTQIRRSRRDESPVAEFYAIDETTGVRAKNAMMVLMNACQKKSKFD